MLRSLRCAALALFLGATSFLPVCAQTSATGSPNPGPTPYSQRRAIMIGQISVSPDGKRIAWLDSGVILVTSFDNLGHSQRITAAPSPEGSCTESDPVWSPDSASLAFLSDCADLGGQSDLYLSHLDSNPPLRLSALHGYVDAPAFSPDGKRIAFLYVEGATRPAGALAAMKRPPASSAKTTSRFSASLPLPPIPVDAPSPPRPPSSRPQPSRLRVRLVARFRIPRLHRRRPSRRKQLVGRQALHAIRCRRLANPLRSSRPPTSPAPSTACKSPFPAGRPTANPSPSSAAS